MGGRASGDGTGFGVALKRLREAAGLSQQELAERSGLNIGGVTKLEQGQREPAWPTVLKLAAALGVDCKAFVADDAPTGDAEAAEPTPAARPNSAARKRGKGREG
jgi:transcriptional regulator with XRE-family HTH domain